MKKIFIILIIVVVLVAAAVLLKNKTNNENKTQNIGGNNSASSSAVSAPDHSNIGITQQELDALKNKINNSLQTEDLAVPTKE